MSATLNRAALDVLLERLGITGEDRQIVVDSCAQDVECRRHWLDRCEPRDFDEAELAISREWTACPQ